MSQVARSRLLHGIDAPPPVSVDLAAGHVAAILDAVDLRQVRVGGTPIVDRVYVAVRDRDWDTIPATITNLDVRRSDSGFAVSFDARHLAGEIDFTWRGTIVGDPDGTITCTMDGEAQTSFAYCRIGFCVLHPDSLAGAHYTARTSEGEISGTLPVLIGPQSLIDGVEQPLFPAFDGLELDTLDGGRVSFTFRGDLWDPLESTCRHASLSIL